MSVMPPARVVAEAFRRQMATGRNRALVVAARDADGSLVQCLIKVPGLMEAPRYPLDSLLEWLGAAFARELKVTVPESYAVEITPAFASSVLAPAIREGLSRSVGVVYGCRFVEAVVPMTPAALPDALRHEAALVLGLDVFIHNLDRRATNPNLLQKTDALIAIDHGDAFAFLIPQLLPAHSADEDPLRFVVLGHACTPSLRRWKRLDFSEVRERITSLTDSRFEAIRAATPAEWLEGDGAAGLNLVLETLRRRRDAIERWLPEVEAALRSS